MRRTIQTAVNALKTHPQKSMLTLRLVPMIKEATGGGASIPVSAQELAEFVKKTSEDFGIKIEYADKLLEKNDWAVDTLQDKEYAVALANVMKTDGVDLLDAMIKTPNYPGYEWMGVEKDQYMQDRTRLVRKMLEDLTV